MLEKNSVYKLTSTDLTNEGNGVCRTEDGIVVFVPGMLPGETADVRIIKTTKSYCIGKLEQFFCIAPERITPPCAVYPRCGGCTLLHLSYEGQLKAKREHVANCLRKFSGTDLIPEECVPSPAPLGYRNKVSMPVSYEDPTVKIGCFAARSHRVIDAEHCLLAEDIFSEIIAELRVFFRENRTPIYNERSGKGLVRHVILRTAANGDIMLGIVINGKKLPGQDLLVKVITRKFPRIRTIVLNHNMQTGNVILGTETTPIFGNGRIRETLLGLSFDISLNTFLQVNHDQTEQLYSYALSFLDESTDAVGADLYCGAGTITLNAAKKCRKIYGIEIVPPAIKDAKNNARINGIENAEFLCADCAEGFAKILEKEGQLDFVIVDPPRKGLVPSVIEDIAKSGAPKVIYVSCDPATLSRDIALFSGQGYTALSAKPFDMFPQSGHVETVVLLSKGHIDSNITCFL